MLLSCLAPWGASLQLAFVRWYETAECEADEELLGMQKLKWAKRSVQGKHSDAWYDVIDLEAIEKPVFLQPHPVQRNCWFYNHFV